MIELLIEKYLNYLAFGISFLMVFIILKVAYGEKANDFITGILAFLIGLFGFFLPKQFLKYFIATSLGFLIISFVFFSVLSFVGPSPEEIRDMIRKHRIFAWIFLIIFIIIFSIAVVKSNLIGGNEYSYNPFEDNISINKKDVIIISNKPLSYYDLYYQSEKKKEILTSSSWWYKYPGTLKIVLFLGALIFISLIPVIPYFEKKFEKEEER